MMKVTKWHNIGEKVLVLAIKTKIETFYIPALISRLVVKLLESHRHRHNKLISATKKDLSASTYPMDWRANLADTV